MKPKKPGSSALSSLGIHFITGLSGPALLSEEQELLERLQPGGIILFRHNIDAESGQYWPERLQQLIEDTKKACARKNLLVSIDHEGGRVHRLPSPVTHFPPARDYREHAFEVGQAMGRELRSLSVNLNFAPVLDIFSEPRNTVIGDRAFGQDPSTVSECAVKFLRGLQGEGVLGCGKHFPGHGDTVADSHYELPVLNAELTILEQRELIPFDVLIKEGISLIMTAHVLYPALDPHHPATLSQDIITNLLRCKLGFQGVVITDALEMQALKHIADGQYISKILEAGVDLFLVAKPESEIPIKQTILLAEQLLRTSEDGELKSSILNESQTRIANVFQVVDNLVGTRQTLPDKFSLIGCEEHQKLFQNIQDSVLRF